MDEGGSAAQRLLSLQDSSYDTLAFWGELPERTVAVASTARNRCLYRRPAAAAHGHRNYGEQAPAPKHWRKERQCFQRQDVLVRGAMRTMRDRVEGPFVRDGLPDVPLFLLVIGGGKRPAGARRPTYKPCFFLISAVLVDGTWQLPLAITKLLAWLWQRWELEVAHRQMKSGLGLGEKQCWNDKATVATVQWSGVPLGRVYALMLLAGQRAWSNAIRSARQAAGVPRPNAGPSTPCGAPCALNSGTTPISAPLTPDPSTTGAQISLFGTICSTPSWPRPELSTNSLAFGPQLPNSSTNVAAG